jgi:hypothetical protein
MVTCAPITTGSVGIQAIATAPIAIIDAAATIHDRFRVVRSINAPAGVWARTVAIPMADMTNPIRDGSQCFVARKIDR